MLASFFLSAGTIRADDLTDWRTKMQPITPLGYVVHYTAKLISIDGKLDDPAWAAAPWTSDFVDIEGNAKPRPRFRTRAKMLWDDNYLYIAAELEEPHVWGTLAKHDSVIFRDPDFEVFIDPDGDTHAYSEFEINALNTSWDLLLPKPYQDGGPPQDSWEILGLKTAVHVDGTLNRASDTDRGWTVEIAFPWKAFEAHARHAGPPVEGEQWRLNFSRVEWKISIKDGTYQKVPDTPEDNWVWSPQGVIDMHRPEMWSILQFTRKTGDAEEVTSLGGKPARDRVLEVYYAERGFFAEHQRWAGTLDELGLGGSGAELGPQLELSADGYICRSSFTDEHGARREWCIRQDRELTLQTAPAAKSELFRDSSAALGARVRDLISRLTLDEKAGLMKNESPGVPRLGIAPYDWWNEALHGVARAGHATVFPQAIGLAAMWDTDEMQRVADVISTEGRAIYNDAIAHDIHARYHGINFWSPNINIFRDPRWGRGQETYGEDPFLTAQTAVAFVRGLQGEPGGDGRYLKTAAGVKHLAVHSGPEATRYTANVDPDPADLNETYLPAFESVVRDGHVEAVMTAYNSIYGVPCTVSPLLYSRLRDWKFDGHVVSDCGAVYILFEKYGIARDFAEAEAKAVKAGLCLRCGDGPATLADAVRRGLLTEAQLDDALFRLLRTWFRLGVFDPPSQVPYSEITIAANNTPANGAVTLEAARKSIVLLKNDGALPLKRNALHRVLVVGPNADSVPALLGNYNGTPSAPVTILSGLRAALEPEVKVDAALGCDYVAAKPGLTTIPRTALSLIDVGSSDEGDSSGLRSEMYPNLNLEGAPVITGRFREVELALKDDASLTAGVSAKNHSARFHGLLATNVAGDYTFSISAVGSVRLFLGDDLIVDAWKPGAKNVSATKRLPEHAAIPIRLEYSHDSNADGAPAKLNLQWGVPPADGGFSEALAKARDADAIIFVGGISAQLEGEDMRVDFDGFAGGDRTRIELPEIQQRLVTALASTGKPVVMVNLSGGAMAFGEANEQASAILQAWYPGQAGGTAVADVLLGKTNPAGRLPVTFYRATSDLPEFSDYRMIARTYRYFRGTVLYPFGHGLSYTRFDYANLRATPRADGGVDLAVDVTNSGERDGEEVVQAYAREPAATHARAVRSLAGFRRVWLGVGEKKTVKLSIEPKWLRRWNADQNELMVPEGEWGFDIGSSSADIRGSTIARIELAAASSHR